MAEYIRIGGEEDLADQIRQYLSNVDMGSLKEGSCQWVASLLKEGKMEAEEEDRKGLWTKY